MFLWAVKVIGRQTTAAIAIIPRFLPNLLRPPFPGAVTTSTNSMVTPTEKKAVLAIVKII